MNCLLFHEDVDNFESTTANKIKKKIKKKKKKLDSIKSHEITGTDNVYMMKNS